MLSTTPSAQTTLQNTQRNRFHELTTQAFGVLADQAWGSLRRDLTAAFANQQSHRRHHRPQSPGNPNGLPVSPVLSVAQIYLRGSMQADTNLANPNNVTISYYLTPVAVLWNPYNATLRASDYRIPEVGDGSADTNLRRNNKASVILQYKGHLQRLLARLLKPPGRRQLREFSCSRS